MKKKTHTHTHNNNKKKRGKQKQERISHLSLNTPCDSKKEKKKKVSSPIHIFGSKSSSSFFAGGGSFLTAAATTGGGTNAGIGAALAGLETRIKPQIVKSFLPHLTTGSLTGGCAGRAFGFEYKGGCSENVCKTVKKQYKNKTQTPVPLSLR